MKKRLVSFSTIMLFAATLFCTFSTSPKGKSSFFSQAKATNGGTWKLLIVKCPGGLAIQTCGAGTDASCTPWGSCGSN